MANDRLSEIRLLIDRADHAYYSGGQALMSDDVYDALENELRALCPSDERLTRVGAPVLAASVLAKRSHAIPMGSQNKATNPTEFTAWVAGLGLWDATLHVNLKADGGSVSLEYVNGSLFRAVTRGDGLVGEDITVNAVQFRGIPIKGVRAGSEPFTGHVRGEIVLSTEAWKALDPEMSTNPRNLGNGMSRRKDGTDVEHLQVVAFRAYREDGLEVGSTEAEMEASLVEMGFEVSPSVVGGLPEVCAFYESIRATRSSLPYWIDGLVVKLNDLAAQRALGVSSNCPKGQVAFKFPAAGKETVLRSVELSVGHTGAVIPTANLDPVSIGGTTVSSALLCNWDEIRALDVAVGDTVIVAKMGDIIPKIVQVVSRPADRKPIPEPTACPICGGPLERKTTLDGEESAHIFCANDDCPAKIAGKIARWLKSLKILGIGSEVLTAIAGQLNVRDAADLYTLKAKKAELAALTLSGVRFGEKRATKVLEAIELSRSLTIEEFVGSLGIEALGKRRVELVRQAVPGEMDALSSWLDGTLAKIAERANLPRVAARIVADLERKRPLIEKLLANGVSIKDSAAVAPRGDAPSFCFTGSLSKPRSQYEGMVKARGWVVKSDVPGATYLVIADPDSTSAKAVKARKLGTRCIGEDQLVALLG